MLLMCKWRTTMAVNNEDHGPSNISVQLHHYRCVVLCFLNVSQKGRLWAAWACLPGFWQLYAKWEHVIANISNPGGAQPPWGPSPVIRQLCKQNLIGTSQLIWATCPNTDSQRDLTTEERGGCCWVIWRTACQLVYKQLWDADIQLEMFYSKKEKFAFRATIWETYSR